MSGRRSTPPRTEGTLDRELVVPKRLAGRRLSEVLQELCPDETRSQLERMVRRGRVKRNGEKVVRSNQRVDKGDVLAIKEAGPSVAPEPELVPLYEDDALLVFDKPAGLMTHATERRAGAHHLSTIANRRYGPLPMLAGADRPGVVHRLDRETSGLIVLARTDAAFEHLKRQFRLRLVQKRYLALVHEPNERELDDRFEVDRPLAARTDHPDRQRLCDPGEGKPARTHFERLEFLDDYSLFECAPTSGRRHQIRLHLYAKGSMLVGERLYKPRDLAPWPKAAPPAKRHALHAWKIEFEHPATGERMTFEAPMPSDVRAWVEWLRESGSSLED